MYSAWTPAPPRTAPSIPAPSLITLLALTMGVFLVTLNVTVVTVALPDIQRSLHARPDELEWVIDAYNLVGASLLLSAGFFADRFGRQAGAGAPATPCSRAARSCARWRPAPAG